MLIDIHMDPKILINKNSKSEYDSIVSIQKILKHLKSPGEMVGRLAAQSIGHLLHK